MTEMNLEESIESLTVELGQLAHGKSVSVVLGAALNLVLMTAQGHQTPVMRSHISKSLRDIADQLDAGGPTQ